MMVLLLEAGRSCVPASSLQGRRCRPGQPMDATRPAARRRRFASAGPGTHAPSGPSRGFRSGATARRGSNGPRTLGPTAPDAGLVARQACRVTQRQGGPGKGRGVQQHPTFQLPDRPARRRWHGHSTRPPGGPPLTGVPCFPLRRPMTLPQSKRAATATARRSDRDRANRSADGAPAPSPVHPDANPPSPPPRHPGPSRAPGQACQLSPPRSSSPVRGVSLTISSRSPIARTAAEDDLVGPHGPGGMGLGALGPGTRLGFS
jgi:hypothetical protein